MIVGVGFSLGYPLGGVLYEVCAIKGSLNMK